VMTIEIKKDSIASNINENLTNNKIIKARKILINNWNIFVQNISEKRQTMELKRTNIKDVNIMKIEEEDLPLEQEMFQAAIQKSTTTLNAGEMQIKKTNS
ncbi:37287_t:CDS:2, partial [Gigaspora margarita]